MADAPSPAQSDWLPRRSYKRRTPKPPIWFLPSCNIGPFMSMSAAIAEDASGAFAGGDIREQTERALDRMRQRLQALNMDLDRLASTQVYLRDPADFAAMNEVYQRYWPMEAPARTTVGARLHHPDALVAITGVALPAKEPRDTLKPVGWLSSPNPYSYIVRSGYSVYMSGLVSRNPRTNTLIEGDAAMQTRVIFENARELLQTCGLQIRDIIFTRLYVTDRAYLTTVDTIFREYFPREPPARLTMVTPLMNPKHLVEITMYATKTQPRGLTVAMPRTEWLQTRSDRHYSAVAYARNRLFISGMIGVTPETMGDPIAQVQLILRRVFRLLQMMRFAWRELRELTILCRDPSIAQQILNELEPLLPVRRFPAGVVLGTELSSPDADVEIGFVGTRDWQRGF
jgi:enamine deaminase RidA (YjgF/YER057c/UK114 family)